MANGTQSAKTQSQSKRMPILTVKTYQYTSEECELLISWLQIGLLFPTKKCVAIRDMVRSQLEYVFMIWDCRNGHDTAAAQWSEHSWMRHL